MQDREMINQIAEECFQTEDESVAEVGNKLIDMILNRSDSEIGVDVIGTTKI